MNKYPADSIRIDAKDLTPGQDFIFNYLGGNRTVYRATAVRSGAGQTVIFYTVLDSDIPGEWQFSTASLSTLVLIGN